MSTTKQRTIGDQHFQTHQPHALAGGEANAKAPLTAAVTDVQFGFVGAAALEQVEEMLITTELAVALVKEQSLDAERLQT